MPTALKLRYYGDPVLRKHARPLKSVGPAERLIVREMIRAMYDFEGSGLAAPQVGIDEQIFVADAGDGPFVIINPEILEVLGKETVLEEGCLSLPGIRIGIKRPESIRVKYLDETGRVYERVLTGLMAKIFQHEGDHLFGRMIIDYATPADREKFKVQLAKLEALSSSLTKSKVNV
ncbi:MAG: peptide deformylase [Candidatus Omnitrophica bacterium]|nr:peptide deformylase [Candidatus Omnitrophota bacterium]MBF0620016.1 peptide deformylase [Candidatus Omnitrophota bacterium]